MIYGIMIAVLCVLLLLKAVSRKLKLKTLDYLLKKCHIPVGVLSIVLIVIHIIITSEVWKTREILIMISGIVLTTLILLMALGYVVRRKFAGSWIKLHRLGAVLILGVLICHVVFYYVDFFAYQANIANVQITGVNAAGMKDGTYTGEYDAGYIYALVEVTVKDEVITEINILEHKNERGAKAEVITENIIEQQTTDVDAISSATNSSLVIKKAVENALTKGI